MKKFFVAALVGFFSAALYTQVFAAEAAEAGNSGRSLTGFFRKLFNYPVKATKETGKTVGHTLSNTGEKVVAATGENTAQVVQGDLGKTGELVAEPVVGAAQTVGQTAAETVQIPVEAAKEEPAAEQTGADKASS